MDKGTSSLGIPAVTPHHAGFITLLGKPNAGKSTLFNKFTRQPLAMATHKAQTTRHNLLGIVQGEGYQAIYVDTPGYLEPAYSLQGAMMRSVRKALAGTDIALWVADVRQAPADAQGLALLGGHHHLVVLLNKSDLVSPSFAASQQACWEALLPPHTPLHLLSARNQAQVDNVGVYLLASLPVHPPYYDEDALTDRSYRFFAAEIIRKAIFLHYHQELPYSTEVAIERFVEEPSIIHIEATLYVERPSQKQILIGKGGKDLKVVGTAARHALQDFLGKHVFLSQHVKILRGWRKKNSILQRLGYP